MMPSRSLMVRVKKKVLMDIICNMGLKGFNMVIIIPYGMILVNKVNNE